MTQRDHENDQSATWLQRLGNAVYLFMAALAVILFLVRYLIRDETNPVDPWGDFLLNLSAGLMLVALVFFVVKALGFDLEGQRYRNLETLVRRLIEKMEKADQTELALPMISEFKETARELTETISGGRLVEQSGLFGYYDQIVNVPAQEWYEQIENATGDISLMSPSLAKWFINRNRMRGLLVSKAINGTKIRFLIMGHENTVGLGIASLGMHTKANVDFYSQDSLKANEDLLTALLSDVNRMIMEDSKGTCTNFVELKKVMATPIFVKAEFFGDNLHWSFFGYNLDGNIAPSFWCRKKNGDGGKSQRLYKVIRDEFETMWGNDSISSQIDVLPTRQV
jgi:hypothetical protein